VKMASVGAKASPQPKAGMLEPSSGRSNSISALYSKKPDWALFCLVTCGLEKTASS
jgi:hypothetical protein